MVQREQRKRERKEIVSPGNRIRFSRRKRRRRVREKVGVRKVSGRRGGGIIDYASSSSQRNGPTAAINTVTVGTVTASPPPPTADDDAATALPRVSRNQYPLVVAETTLWRHADTYVSHSSLRHLKNAHIVIFV